MTRALYRLGRFAVERRRRVLLAWVVLAVVLTVAARSSGGESNDDFRVPGVESQAAIDLLEERFPDAAGGRAQVVLHVEDGSLNDEVRADEIADALAEVGRHDHDVLETAMVVAGVVNPERPPARATGRGGGH